MGIQLPFKREESGYVPVGVISGLLQGCTGMGGPPIVLFFVNQGAGKTRTRADLTVIFALISLAALLAQLTHGLITADVVRLVAWMTPVTVGGTILGARWAGRFEQDMFRRVVLLLVMATGVISVVTAL